MLGVLHGLFRIDHPLLVVEGREQLLPGRGLGECSTTPGQSQTALRMELHQAGEVETPEAAREDPDGQEEVGATRSQRVPSGASPPAGRTQCRCG